MSALYVAGLVVALRRWKDRGRSARLAAAGFAIGLLGDVGEIALTFVHMRHVSATAAASVETDPWLWPMFAATALRSFTRPASLLLILLALWFAWRDTDRAVRRDAVT